MPAKNKEKKAKGSSSNNLGGKRKGPVLNGFYTLAEPDCLSVKPENIAEFSLPLEALSFTPKPDAVVTSFKNGDKERKIYCNIELTEVELEQLKKCQEEARSQGLEFLPSVAVMASRFLSRARGDPVKAVRLMQATQDWRLSYFKDGPVADTDVLEDMKYGIVYFCGRDSAFRPTIIVRATRIPQQWYKEKRIDKLIKILIFCMEYMLRYMVLPGAIENNVLIVDLKGLGLSQVPLGALSEIYKVMSHHYIGRVFRFYIVNMSGTLSTIAGMAKNILTDRQKQKLVFLDSVKELTKEFALHQLEEDLGGTRPIVKEFFPFPLEAGPFDSGSNKGPDAAAIPRAHEVLSKEGAAGRLWDPSLSNEENLQHGYAPEAFDWFERAGVPVPADLRRQHESRLQAEALAREKEKERELSRANFKDEDLDASIANADASTMENGSPLAAPPDEADCQSNASYESDDVIVQDTAIKPKGFFSCRPCWCSTR